MGDLGDPQGRITRYWDLRGATYDSQPGHELATPAERAAWLAALRELLPPAPADILDVGTGTGFLALLLAELGHRVTGIDLAEGMLAIAREKAARLARPPIFARGDAIAPLLPPSSVDVVISRHLLWTLTDLPGAFANWRQLLRPGGRVVAIDALWWSDTPPAAAPDPDDDSWSAQFPRHYSPEVRDRLPLMSARSPDPALAAARGAFERVRVSHLAELERVEQAANPQRAAAPRYVITAEAGT